MSKTELIDALKKAQALLKKHGQSINPKAKGLIPLFAVGLTAFDQKKVQEIAAFMASPGMHAYHHAPGVIQSTDIFYRQQQNDVITAIKFYLGDDAGLPNEKGIIDDLLARLAKV